jgi:hypothetical protein|tara:strand:+ start:3584 stop:3850 length:267 start_codon:yes stop_codon:yes gene_type:complete
MLDLKKQLEDRMYFERARKEGMGNPNRTMGPREAINAKYGKKGSEYRAGSPMRNLMKDKMAQKAAISDFDATEAPAIEESLYKEDDLG